MFRVFKGVLLQLLQNNCQINSPLSRKPWNQHPSATIANFLYFCGDVPRRSKAFKGVLRRSKVTAHFKPKRETYQCLNDKILMSLSKIGRFYSFLSRNRAFYNSIGWLAVAVQWVEHQICVKEVPRSIIPRLDTFLLYIYSHCLRGNVLGIYTISIKKASGEKSAEKRYSTP